MLTVADMLTTALTWHAAGYSVIPIKGDGSKQPALDTWRAYMDRQPDEMDVARWGRTHSGMGVVCGGPMSLEMLEVEGYALYTAPIVRALMDDNGLGDLWDRLMGGYLERSPRGGLHIFLRICDGPARGNTKLASRPHPDEPGKVQVLWETRGQGGQSVIAPSAGGTSRDGEWAVVQGTVADIPAITADERDQVYAVLTMLDEMPAADPAPAETGRPRSTDSDELRPGDDYSNRTTWDDILVPRGWTKVKQMGAGWAWRRPGKTDTGISATTGQAKDGVDRLFVFSTSTEFQSERPYSKFAAYTLLEHRGDWTAATRALRAAGYGAPEPDVDGWVNSLPAATPVVVETTLEDDVFGATPTLEHIRTAARARMVSPWALLGAVLARVVAEVPPRVTLPAIIGSRASLNAFYANVGPSGASKTAAANVADDLLDIEWAVARVQGTGSGEGLVASFLQRDPNDPKGELVTREHPNVMVVVDEIGQIAAIQSRQGSSLAPVLRSAWSGSTLDNVNADPTRRRIVPKMSYRLTAIAGVQPLAAQVLFDDADTGTPQRWVWLPALDPHIPDQEPDWPGPITWRLPIPTWDHHGNHIIAVPDHVRETVRAAHRARHRGAGDMLDGHLTLTRLKVAAALAILHGGYDIDDDLWGIAGQVMEVSVQVREQCQQAIRDEAERAMRNRGRIDQARESGRREAVAEAIQKDAARVYRAVDTGSAGGHEHPEEQGCTRRCITQRLPRRTPEQRDVAIAYALDMDWVAATDDGPRQRFTKGSSRPAEGL